ncbi:NIPSNAP family protein [Actinoplanes sp. NPDC051494]|uniref:NIPSNAP family protein n=1 Tax=Actinoplanes sp. NPDC051494 TaxID=3363907 RepID=UPI00378CD7F3
MSYPIVELRQYTLHPGRRDELIELFDREFVETQEALGMGVLGQFRDVDAPDRFVWLRGFPDMASRAASLAAFYGGPVWAAYRDRANATMIAFDDVLLLRELPGGTGLPLTGTRLREDPPSRVVVTLRFADAPFTAYPSSAGFTTEYSENTFPALPVREGEHVLVTVTRCADQAAADAHVATLGDAEQALVLAPTSRSLVR